MKKLLWNLTGIALACAMLWSAVPAMAAEQPQADIISDDAQGFDELTLGTIFPEAYTGRPVKPKVRLIYHGAEDQFLEGVDYTVTYSDNVEKGTGCVTVTSLMEELPGTLTGTFTICDAEDIAEETAKLLPDHMFIEGCADVPYEYIEHAFILENLKYFYDCGLELSDESLARMNEQYAAHKKLGTFRDNDVEVYAALRALNYPLSDVKLSAKDPISSNKSRLVKMVKSIASVDELLSCYEIGLGVRRENGTYMPSALLPGRNVALKIPLPRDCDVEALNGHMRAYILTENSSRPVEIGPEYIRAAERNGEKYVTVRTSRLGYVAVFRAEPPVFADVPEDSVSYDAIRWAVGEGDINVTKAAAFFPDANWTRAQAVTFLWRAYGQPTPTMTEKPFGDVDETSPLYTAIRWAAERGITLGTCPGKFEPMAPCTRAQAVTFLWRAAGKPDASESGTFSDVAVPSYYADAVAWAAAEGITNGISAAAFEPNAASTRAQVVTFLYRGLA